MAQPPRGRPGRFAAYESFAAELPPVMKKRPAYKDGLGLFRGERGETAWIKISLRKGNLYRGKSYAPGKAVEIKLGCKTSWPWGDMEVERVRLQALADRGEPLEDALGVTFANHAEAWLQRKKDAVRGWGVMAGHVRKHLDPVFGRKNLEDITLRDVNHWIATQRLEHKPATVLRQMSTLKAILNDAVKAGLLSESPTRHADTIKVGDGRMRSLTMEEFQAVLNSADRIEAETNERSTYKDHEIKGWLRNFLLWAIHSGMRRQEILNLSFQHFEDLADGKARLLIEKTKSGVPRWISCSDEMIAIRERMRLVRRADGDDRVFPISLSTAKRKLTKLWKSCGLKDVRLHDLRRTHATQLINSGVDLRTVGGRIGHSDLKMLQKHYAVFLGDADAAVKTQEIFARLV